MNAAVAWVFAACAVLLVPGRRPVGSVPVRRAAAAAPVRRQLPPAFGVIVATGSTALCCVVLLGPRSGLVAAAVGCPAVAAGLHWLQRRPVRVPPDRALALTLDLAAAALRSGRPLADALTLAAPAAHTGTAEVLHRVAALSRLGADPAQAWSAVPRDGPLGQVAAVAVRSAASGIKLAGAFERLAGEIRAERAALAAARAHRAGVVAMAPLAACFLPSFVCLGVIPVVVGIARTAFGVSP